MSNATPLRLETRPVLSMIRSQALANQGIPKFGKPRNLCPSNRISALLQAPATSGSPAIRDRRTTAKSCFMDLEPSGGP